jgi:hypothetical protein
MRTKFIFCPSCGRGHRFQVVECEKCGYGKPENLGPKSPEVEAASVALLAPDPGLPEEIPGDLFE